MKKTHLILLLLFILSLLSSCQSYAPITKASIGDKCYLNVRIFQAFNSQEALAIGIDNNNIIVKLITNEDTFYDEKRLSGIYIMVNTYTYETKKGSIKTVPVFIKATEAKSLPTFSPEQTKEHDSPKI